MSTSTPRHLEDLDLPPWFVNAAKGLKASRPRWAKKFPVITLRSSETLPSASYAWILGAMVYMEAEAVRHDLLDLLTRHADPASLDAWMATLFDAWIAGSAPSRDAWVLTAAGNLGGDATVRALQRAVRKWIRDKERTLAVRGVDALGRIGTKAALEEIATLAAETRSSSASDEALQMVEKKARMEGTSRDEIEDRHVADCGLDSRGERTLSYGPRVFRAVLGKDLRLALYAPDNRRRASLPPPASSDDLLEANASRAAWAEMKLTYKRVLRAQLKRFEQAMITGRTWSFEEFQTSVLRHPIITRIAQLLVWQTLGETPRQLRVTEDLTFADLKDEHVALENSERLRVAHPLRLAPAEVTAWSELLTDYRIVQPFPQLSRPAYHCELAIGSPTRLVAPEHTPIKSGVLYGVLDNDGWRLGAANDSLFTWSWKSFAGDGVTAVISYSGFVPGAIAKSPDQRITGCTFYSGVMTPEQRELPGRPMPLNLVPPVAFSETMRRLVRLTSLES